MPRTPEQHNEEEKAFKFGENIFVQRSSGEVEAGWEVHGYNGDNVVVRKTEKDGKVLEKEIPENELKALMDAKTEEIRKISGV